MGTPLIHLTQTTCLMLAKYHAGNTNYEGECIWLRVGLTLHAVERYNAGKLTEESLQDYLRVAQDQDEGRLREVAYNVLD